jgi:Sugar (and other) transporter
MGVSMFMSGGLSKAAQLNPDKAAVFGAAAASFTFIFTAGFGATWLTIPWLYPAEIFPLQVRAKGNAWGVVGWSIGNGWCVSILHPQDYD